MFESLKAEIAQVTDETLVDWREFKETFSLIDSLCPEIWLYKMKGHTKKAARILWMRWLVGREIKSAKELYGDEMWLIHAFITGIHGQFTKDDFGDEFQAMNASANQSEFVKWCDTYPDSIRRFAEQIIAPKEKAKQKAYRERQKKSKPMPF